MIARVVSMLFNFVMKSMMCHIHLTSKNRFKGFKSFSFTLFIDTGTIVGKLFYAKHHAMICQGHAFHSILNSFIYESGYLGLSVKYRIICMDMKVYKVLHKIIIWVAKVLQKTGITK